MRALLIVFALLWLIVVGAFIWWRDPAAVVAMSPSEWGEFLAGVFGPLGFLAVLFTLIQQGADQKHQRALIDVQLRTHSAQLETQKILAKAATDQAAVALKQAEIANQRTHIESVRSHANSLAMMGLRYSERLRLSYNGQVLWLIGTKDELGEDMQLGPVAVLETVRSRLREALSRIKTDRVLPADGSERQRLNSLSSNLLARIDLVSSAFTATDAVPELVQLKIDLALPTIRRHLAEVRSVLNLEQSNG